MHLARLDPAFVSRRGGLSLSAPANPYWQPAGDAALGALRGQPAAAPAARRLAVAGHLPGQLHSEKVAPQDLEQQTVLSPQLMPWALHAPTSCEQNASGMHTLTEALRRGQQPSPTPHSLSCWQGLRQAPLEEYLPS